METKHEETRTTDRYHVQTSENGWLLCPICGFDYTHMEDAFVTDYRDPVDQYHSYCNVSVLPGKCEAGCRFVIYMAQHKGNTRVWAEDTLPTWSPQPPCGASPQERIAFYQADLARAFGEEFIDHAYQPPSPRRAKARRKGPSQPSPVKLRHHHTPSTP